MKETMDLLGLGPKEMAYLLGVSDRAVRRGIGSQSASGKLLQVIEKRLGDPRSTQSIRALAIISARNGGLEAMLNHLLESYVTLDLLRLR